MTTTILSQTTTQLKTVEPLFPGDYIHGLILIHWTECGRSMLTLDDGELLGLLRVLPAALLVEVLGERGVLCTMGGEAPDVARELDALAAESLTRHLDATSEPGDAFPLPPVTHHRVPGHRISSQMRPPLTIDLDEGSAPAITDVSVGPITYACRCGHGGTHHVGSTTCRKCMVDGCHCEGLVWVALDHGQKAVASPSTSYYTPIWNVAENRYICRHCQMGAMSHPHERSGVLRCPDLPIPTPKHLLPALDDMSQPGEGKGEHKHVCLHCGQRVIAAHFCIDQKTTWFPVARSQSGYQAACAQYVEWEGEKGLHRMDPWLCQCPTCCAMREHAAAQKEA